MFKNKHAEICADNLVNWSSEFFRHYKRTKSPTKKLRIFHNILNYVATLPCEMQSNQNRLTMRMTQTSVWQNKQSRQSLQRERTF